MAYLKVVSGIPPEWGGLATLLGAAVFPICLICILIGGGELATGNMMMMALGRLTKRVSLKKLFRNWIVVSLGNLLGALFMAYFLGHYVGYQKVLQPLKPSRLPRLKCKWILVAPLFLP